MAKKKTNHNEIISNDDLKPVEPIKVESVESTDKPKIGFTRKEVLQLGEPNSTASYKRINVLQL